MQARMGSMAETAAEVEDRESKIGQEEPSDWIQVCPLGKAGEGRRSVRGDPHATAQLRNKNIILSVP